jgi:hypothetical protein
MTYELNIKKRNLKNIKMFSIKIFTVNYYLCNPVPELDHTYSEFKCAEIKQVPIIRIFGSTPEGYIIISLYKFNF